VSLLLVPGLVLAFTGGLRGWTAAGVAPLLSAGLVVAAIIVTSLLDLRWTPRNVAGVTVLVLLVAAGLAVLDRRRRRGRAVDPRRAEGGSSVAPTSPVTQWWWSVLTLAGVVAGGLVGIRTVLRGTGDLRLPNQGFDALFHVNAVETITTSGSANPGVTATVNGYAPGQSVYPDALHAGASLLTQLHGDSLSSINGLMACIPLVAGLGLVALLRSMGLVREAVLVPVLLAVTTGYPTDPVWRGPIWVFAFAIAFVPAFLVLVRRTVEDRTPATVLLLGGSGAALVMLHPSAAVTAAVFVVFLLIARWLGRPATILRDVVVVGTAAVLAAAVALPLVGRALVDTGGGTIVDWPVAQSAGEALTELALYRYNNDHSQVALAVLALVGLAVGWRRRDLRWWYGGTITFAGLCVLAASYEGRVVQLLTGPWWNDRFRFAAVVFLALSVFAAVGAVALGDLVGRALTALARRVGAQRLPGRGVAAGGGLVAVLLVFLATSQGLYVDRNVERLGIGYVAAGGGTVAPNDLEAFAFLRTVAGGGPVLNDPNDGSAWMWSLAGVRPVFGAALTTPVSPPLPAARQLVIDRLDCLDSAEDVRQAVAALGVRYVYSSATTILGPPTTNWGFRDLDTVRSLRMVFQKEGAVVYEIDPVPLVDPDQDSSCARS
jgi:hypothetical protein